MNPQQTTLDGEKEEEGEENSESDEKFDDGYRCEDEDATSEDDTTPKPDFIIFDLPPPPPPPGGLKIVKASSVPCSSTSSPKKWGHDQKHRQIPNPSINSLLHRRRHYDAMSRFIIQQEEARSKSCGDGRSSAPPDDFDLRRPGSISCDDNAEAKEDFVFDSNRVQESGIVERSKSINRCWDWDGFLRERPRCGSFCVSLPKGKRMFFRRSRINKKKKKTKDDVLETADHRPQNGDDDGIGVSKTVSLEKFGCESWASSSHGQEEEKEDAGCSEWDSDSDDSYYDLPLEKITSGIDDTNSPVKATFVFGKYRKGVLKRQGSILSKDKPSTPRRVRFITSSQPPSPPSPSRLIAEQMSKTREELLLYMQALET